MSRSSRRIAEPLTILLIAAGGGRVAPAHADGAEHAPPETTHLDAATVEIPMDLASGRPLVEVSLNGRGPFRFIFDTGASSAVIDPSLVSELGLKTVGSARLGDPRDPEAIASDLVRVDSLRMGGLTLNGVIMATLDVKKMMGPAYAGVLGLFETRELLATLDYPRGKLVLTRGELPADGPGVVTYDASDGIIALPMDVNGHRVDAHLDSGNPGHFMLPHAFASTLTFKAPPLEIGRASTVTNSFAIFQAQLDGDIRVAGVTYHDPEVHLTELLDQWANIGFDALRELSVVVDARNRRLRLDRTGSGSSAAPARRRLGLMLSGNRPGDATPGVADGGLPVRDVVGGSLAEKAGVKAGDVITAVNGRPVKELAPGELADLLGGREALTIDLRRADAPVVVHVD